MWNNGSESQLVLGLVHVLTLDIRVKPESRKEVQTIIVEAGATKRQIHQTISPGGHHLEWFDPPLEILHHTKIFISVHYRGSSGGIITISLGPDTVRASETDGKRVLWMTEGNVEVAVGTQSLPLIVGPSDRFRLLIIGKPGAGKSSLINKVFGTSGLDVSHNTRSQAGLEQEYIARNNTHFIVHDGHGFEAADHRDLDDACYFITRRRRMPTLRDQLHAVWLCLEIPSAGGLVIESGIEDFLKLSDRILGGIPLIVVFTKFDLLMNTLKAGALRTDELDDDALQKREWELLEKICLAPIRAATGKDVLHVAVSTKKGYEGSLSALVEKTTKNVHINIRDQAARSFATNVQRAENISVKLKDEPEFASLSLLVSSLGIRINSLSRKEVRSITLDVGATRREIHKAICPGGYHQERFDPPLEVLRHNKFSVLVHYHGFVRGVVTISLDPETVLLEASERDGKKVYSTTERKVELTIGIQSLPSTVREIMEACDRFRLLIIGKSGVGKSSLINKVFGVAGVDVSDTTRGKAKIDQEHTALDNNRFIVHNSCRFEAGEHGNLDVVRSFIKDRRSMRDIKDRLHAVWLCLEIPYAGGRVIEAGVEEFLRERDQTLGDVPLVVVFTKLDSLVDMLETEALEAGTVLDSDTLRKQKEESLEKRCLEPLRKAAGGDVPHVFVSTVDYEDTLPLLVEETVKNVRSYVKDEAPHYLAAIAQRVNIALKIEATIAAGERRYWKALKASPKFKGHTIKECLDVLHDDIITVWNFKEPHSLHGEAFKQGLLTPPNPSAGGTEDPRSRLTPLQSIVSVVAGLVVVVGGLAAVASPALPIVAPVAGAILLGKVAHHMYRVSQDIVRKLMAYIIDLTCVMQILFLVTAVKEDASEVAIGIAMKAYEETYRRDVHADVSEFPVHLAIAPGKRDEVLDKIKELIGKYRLSDKHIFELQHQVRGAPSSDRA